MTNYLYLHGFASSPTSQKALYLSQGFESEFNITLQIPNLCPGDFRDFTISNATDIVGSFLENSQQSWILIGSSLGGLIAAYVAQEYKQVQRLILLAPAFDFVAIWSTFLGEEVLRKWKQEGYYPVYHHGYQKEVMLGYQFIVDAREKMSSPFERVLPTLIIHGLADETIPIKVSQRYAEKRSWVKLIELNSDHELSNVLPQIWQLIKSEISYLN